MIYNKIERDMSVLTVFHQRVLTLYSFWFRCKVLHMKNFILKKIVNFVQKICTHFAIIKYMFQISKDGLVKEKEARGYQQSECLNSK